MLVCVKCRKEMRCIENGVGTDFGNGHVYAGDKYRCKSCGFEIISTNERAHYDPEYRAHQHYLKMQNAL